MSTTTPRSSVFGWTSSDFTASGDGATSQMVPRASAAAMSCLFSASSAPRRIRRFLTGTAGVLALGASAIFC